MLYARFQGSRFLGLEKISKGFYNIRAWKPVWYVVQNNLKRPEKAKHETEYNWPSGIWDEIFSKMLMTDT